MHRIWGALLDRMNDPQRAGYPIYLGPRVLGVATRTQHLNSLCCGMPDRGQTGGCLVAWVGWPVLLWRLRPCALQTGAACLVYSSLLVFQLDKAGSPAIQKHGSSSTALT